MKHRSRPWLALLLILALPAAAWGPKTQVAIVTTGAQLLSKSGLVGLGRTIKDLQQGAMLSIEQLREMFPDLEANPANAIEQEMYLLHAARGERIDPYFAYRLGALGKVVAEVTTPLQSASPSYRNLYYSEVDKIITSLTLKPGTRERVEPRAYFERVLAEAAVNDTVIEREYESGAGFSEVARSTVATDASRSVDAVADVLYTVVSGQSAAGNVSEAQLRRYIVNAYRFYIARGNKVEIEAAAGRLDGLVAATPAMREEVGDMFSAAGMKERAMVEYRAVVQEAPDRREVVDKMANYYVEQGQAALKEERFESALESFQEALNANPLHPEAEGLRLQAERSLSDREARLSASRGAIQRAEELFSLAEEEALRNRFAEAIDMLRQSMDAYGEVSEEFPAENQERVRGQDKVRERVRQYKQELITNARVFSGTAYAQDVRKFAETAAPDLEERALRALIENEYKAQISALENQLKAEPSR